MSFGLFDPNLARARRARRVTPPPIQNLLAAALAEREMVPEENPYQPAPPEMRPVLPNRELPEYDEAQSAVRPKIADPEQFTEDRIATLSSMPLDPVSGRQKVGRFLQRFGEAQLAQGPARSGLELAGTAMRSAGYGVPQLFGDNAAREMRREEIGQNQGQLLNYEQARQKREARSQAALKQADLVAGIGLKQANTVKALRGPEPKALQHVTVSERAYTFNPNDGTYTDANLPGGPKLKEGRDELGPYLYDPDRPELEVVRPKGVELRQFVDYQPIQGGATYHVPAATAAQGDAGIASSNASAANEGRRQSARDANERLMRGWENDVATWRSAGSAADDYNKTWRALAQNMAEIKAMQGTKDFQQSDDFRQLVQDNRRLSSEVTAAQQSLRSRFGRHVRLLDSGFAELGSQPPKPDVVETPTPAQRQPAGRVGAYAGHTFKQSDLPEIQKRLKAKSPEEARRMVEAQGGKFQ